jgi:hypothetical protein
MDTSTSRTYLPFIRSPIFGLGVGIISSNGAPKLEGCQISADRIVAQCDAIKAQDMIIAPSKISVSIQYFADLVRNLPQLIQGWIIFNEGTCVPLLKCFRAMTDIREFAAQLDDYPIHRIADQDELYKDLAACYMRANTGAKRDEVMTAIRILSIYYPGDVDRWVFMCATKGGGVIGMTWIPPRDINVANFGAVYDESSAVESGIQSDVKIPTVRNVCIEQLIFMSPISLCAIDARENNSNVICAIDARGLEARRLDYMLPIAIAHISLAGEITLL